LTVAVGNAKVDVAVMVGVNVTVGVKVSVGANVGSGVSVSVVVDVTAGTVGVAGTSVEGVQAETNRKINKMIL
jgi:hypothetical protein